MVGPVESHDVTEKCWFFGNRESSHFLHESQITDSNFVRVVSVVGSHRHWFLSSYFKFPCKLLITLT